MALTLNNFTIALIALLYFTFIPREVWSNQTQHTSLLRSHIISSSISSPFFKYPVIGIITLSSTENYDEFFSQKGNILEKSYHGLIRENETSVVITPLIQVDEEKICDFRILSKAYHEIPFKIKLVNNLGVISARRIFYCEKRKTYHFDIVAVFCDGSHSTSANVRISVIDVNEYSPTFSQTLYIIEADEGRLYKDLIRVDATDKDCTPLYGSICKYEILNKDIPFNISNDGMIKNTVPLSYRISHKHIFSVVAYDCAMRKSAPTMVNIRVRRACEARFYGIPERIDYTFSSIEILWLFPNIRLELCDTLCDGQNIIVKILLKTKHLSLSCFHDMSNCSQKLDFIDLLPRDANYNEGPKINFHFNGSSGVRVPNLNLALLDFSQQAFSILTIFRHASTEASKLVKEHIICSADDHKMNRHHMALFVRNCRLILLIRKNFNEGDFNIFSPSEWRWKLSEVCDNEWHHFVLNIDPTDRVELYIDGQPFESSVEGHYNNPEIIDDWPLHAAHGINTTFTIGACYQSSENRFKHGFTGDISEIKIYFNGMLTDSEIKCGINCDERLILPYGEKQFTDSNTLLHTNNQQTKIFIKSRSKDSIEKLLHHIQYVNIKQNSIIGRRNVELHTSLMCKNLSIIRLPTVETYIMVNEIHGKNINLSTLSNYSSFHMKAILVPPLSTTTSNSFKNKDFKFNQNEKENLQEAIYHIPQSKGITSNNKYSEMDTTKIFVQDEKVFYQAKNHQHEVDELQSHLRAIKRGKIELFERIRPSTLILLICVFFVIFLSGISIARLMNNKKHKYHERHQSCAKNIGEGLIWDNSSLTITINPMQCESISDDSSQSESTDTEEEEVNGSFANVSQLEWDNSNIFTTMPLN